MDSSGKTARSEQASASVLARELRAELVGQLARNGDLHSPRVTEALLAVPRHAFVESEPLRCAYENRPLPTDFGQTISQPTVVAIMTEALELSGRERVLEVGTGSGYQTAVLALLASHVYSIESLAPLAHAARGRLAHLGIANVEIRVGDGYAGWPERAPFDRIIVTAAPPEIPAELIAQLVDGGIVVVPVGPAEGPQSLLCGRKCGPELDIVDLGPVRFVPMERRHVEH